MMELYHPGNGVTSPKEGLPSPTLPDKARFNRKINVALGREPSWPWVRDFSMLLVQLHFRTTSASKASKQILFLKEGKILTEKNQHGASFANDPTVLQIMACIAPEVHYDKNIYTPIIAGLRPETLDEAIHTFGEHTVNYQMATIVDKQTRDITDRVILVITTPDANPLDNRIVDANTYQPIRMTQAKRLGKIFQASLDTLIR